MNADEYLISNRIIDCDSPIVRNAAQEITAGLKSDREKAVAIYQFVRDRIKFGFAPKMDHAPASLTIRKGVGHCQPCTFVFVALLRATGIPARIHFVVVPLPVMRYVLSESQYASTTTGLTHGYTEVHLDDAWMGLDSYIIDPPLYQGAMDRLKSDSLEMGYGIDARGVNDWDGQGPSFVQFVHDGELSADINCGVYADPTLFYRSDRYLNRMSAVETLLYPLVRGAINKKIERIRSGKR